MEERLTFAWGTRGANIWSLAFLEVMGKPVEKEKTRQLPAGAKGRGLHLEMLSVSADPVP